MDVQQSRVLLPDREYPPFEGFQIGSEEDTLANCLNLIPKPPRKDFIKFMEKDRCVCHYGTCMTLVMCDMAFYVYCILQLLQAKLSQL